MSETNNKKVFIFTTTYHGKGYLFDDENKNICTKKTNRKLKFGNNEKDTKYYQLKGKEIYATTPLDDHTIARDFIELLIKVFAEDANEIYLLLHDKDIYFESVLFKILNPEEINKYTERNNVHILVFQHEPNRVTKLLKSNSSEYIEEQIEFLFEHILSDLVDYNKGYIENIDNEKVKRFLKVFDIKLTDNQLTFFDTKMLNKEYKKIGWI